MYEQNQAVPDLTSAINLLEMQRLQINQLNGVIEDQRLSLIERDNRLERARLIGDSYKEQRDKAKEIITNAIACSDISPEECEEPFWEELFEALGVEATKQVDFIFKVEFSGTMTLPIGKSLQDYAGEIDIPDIGADTRDISIVDVSVNDYDIEEA